MLTPSLKPPLEILLCYQNHNLSQQQPYSYLKRQEIKFNQMRLKCVQVINLVITTHFIKREKERKRIAREKERETRRNRELDVLEFYSFFS